MTTSHSPQSQLDISHNHYNSTAQYANITSKPKLPSQCVDVRFTDVSYEIPPPKTFLNYISKSSKQQPTKILNNITGYVGAGESLAILGPSGSGKTSFLNLLAARSEHPQSSGQILFGGHPRLPRTKRHIGYVMQDDVFFSKLTVRETLEFTANIRLGHSLTKEQRSKRVDSVLERLRLTKCQHTRIGDQQFDKGISGGERKRVNIANELLHTPSLLLADECTSGLDSSSAFTVINLLRELCTEGKTVIATIHQPSSQMFSLFDKIMLLAAGRVAYFGRPDAAVSYFHSIDFPFPNHAYNPADYMLELVIDDGNIQDDDSSELQEVTTSSESLPSNQKQILDAWERRGPKLLQDNEESIQSKTGKEMSTISTSSNEIDANRVIELEENDDDNDPSSTGDENASSSDYGLPSIKNLDQTFMKEQPAPPTSILGRCKRALVKRFYDATGQHKKNMPEKYDAGWFRQAYFLALRSLKQKKGLLIQPLYIVQLFAVILISSLFWFQIEPRESTIEDRLGALSFFAIFWSFYSTFNTLFAFPAEKQVLNKDRAGGNYRLSAYYVAKSLVETPADMIYPLIFGCITYPLVGLNKHIGSFLLFSLILILNVLAAQGVGLFISAIVMDIRKGQVLGTVWILSSMLISGYYIDPDNIPSFVAPLRVLSFIKYSYEAFIRSEMLFGQSFKCDGNHEKIYSTRGCPITSEGILAGAQLEDSLPIAWNIAVLLLWIVLLRIAGYFALKLLHTNHKPKLSSWKTN